MNAAWSSLSSAFAARTRRERVAVALVTVVCVPLAVVFAWVEPNWRLSRSLTGEIDQLRHAPRVPAVAADPNALAREEIASLEARLRGEQSAVADLARTLVGPAEMPVLIESMVRKSPGVRLTALRSLGSEPWRTAPAPASAASSAAPAAAPGGAANGVPAVLYQHGMELELEGSWADLQGYLASIERLPKRLLWGQLELKAERYPQLAMKLRLHTLSMDPAWMQL